MERAKNSLELFLSRQDQLSLFTLQSEIRYLTKESDFFAIIGVNSEELKRGIILFLQGELSSLNLDSHPINDAEAVPAFFSKKFDENAVYLWNIFTSQEPLINSIISEVLLRRDFIAQANLKLIILCNHQFFGCFLNVADLRNFTQFQGLFTDRQRLVSQDLIENKDPEQYHAFDQAYKEMYDFLGLPDFDIPEALAKIHKTAELATTIGQYEYAEELCNHGFQIAKAAQQPLYQAAFLSQKGLVAKYCYKYDEALQNMEQALLIDREVGYAKGIAAVLGNMGIAYLEGGAMDKASEYFEDALQQCPLEEKELRAVLLSHIANAYSLSGKKELALSHIRQSLEEHQAANLEVAPSVLINAGNIYDQAEHFHEAIHTYRKALECVRSFGNHHLESALVVNIGQLFRKVSEYETAVQYLEQALEVQEARQDQPGQLAAHTNLGLTYRDLQDYGRSILHLEQALSISNALGLREDQAKNLGNIGAVHHIRGDLKKAVEYYEKAYEINLNIGWLEGQATCLGNLGLFYLELEKFEEALAYFKEGLQIAIDIQDTDSMAHILGNLATVYLATDSPGQALEYALQAYSLNRSLNNLRNQAINLQDLALIYTALKEPEEAARAQSMAEEIQKTMRE